MCLYMHMLFPLKTYLDQVDKTAFIVCPLLNSFILHLHGKNVLLLLLIKHPTDRVWYLYGQCYLVLPGNMSAVLCWGNVKFVWGQTNYIKIERNLFDT